MGGGTLTDNPRDQEEGYKSDREQRHHGFDRQPSIGNNVISIRSGIVR